MTTREYLAIREAATDAYLAYGKKQRERVAATREFLKKITVAKHNKILSPREVDIMRLRLQKKKTLEEVARTYDVTRERIRLIEEGVYNKLMEL